MNNSELTDCEVKPVLTPVLTPVPTAVLTPVDADFDEVDCEDLDVEEASNSKSDLELLASSTSRSSQSTSSKSASTGVRTAVGTGVKTGVRTGFTSQSVNSELFI